MSFNVGDRVRMDRAYIGSDQGFVTTITKIVDGEYRCYPIPPSGASNVYDHELTLILTVDPPTNNHDYMLGYAAGFNHPAGETPYDRSDSADFRAGFVAGWDRSVADDRADMLASI